MEMEAGFLASSLLLITACYGIVMLYLVVGWNKIPVYEQPKQAVPVQVSILIPARNEQANLSGLVADLEQQQYPTDAYEVIVIDDSSTDGTLELAHKLAVKAKCTIKVLSLKGTGLYSKKQALTKGIEAAKGDLIITTDADCRVGTQWLTALTDAYKATHADLLCGPVILTGEPTVFTEMQSIEFASLIGTGGVCIFNGWPAMGNGANLAFTKAAYLAAGGYEGTYHIASGDDEHLMQKVSARGGKIVFVKNKKAVVTSGVKPDLSSFVEQRKRWASKWRYNKDVKTVILALAVFAFHSFILLSMLAALTGFMPVYLFACIFMIKAVSEGVFLRIVTNSLGRRFSISAFLVLQFLHSLYIVYIGLLVNVKKTYIWKERELV